MASGGSLVAIVLLIPLAILMFFSYIVSIVKAIRDRRELKQRLKQKNRGEETPSTSFKRTNIKIIHDYDKQREFLSKKSTSFGSGTRSQRNSIVPLPLLRFGSTDGVLSRTPVTYHSKTKTSVMEIELIKSKLEH